MGSFVFLCFHTLEISEIWTFANGSYCIISLSFGSDDCSWYSGIFIWDLPFQVSFLID